MVCRTWSPGRGGLGVAVDSRVGLYQGPAWSTVLVALAYALTLWPVQEGVRKQEGKGPGS